LGHRPKRLEFSVCGLERSAETINFVRAAVGRKLVLASVGLPAVQSISGEESFANFAFAARVV